MIDQNLLITIVSTIVIGVSAQMIAERTKIPSIIFLLGAGVIFGPDVLNLINPSLLGSALFVLTTLSVAIILFEGGLTLDIRNVRHVSASVINLITFGAIITWVGAAVVSWAILGFSWKIAILFGSLVIVTGPTVIGPLLRAVKITRGIRTILKWEGILIDPVGAIIAILTLGFFISEEPSLGGTIAGLGGRIIFGTLIGFMFGLFMNKLMRIKMSESVSTLSIFAVVFLMYGVSELILKESGIMSVTIAGIVMGNLKVPNLNIVKGFKEKLTILLVSVLFVLLAANLRISEIDFLGWDGVFVVLCLMFIVRPLNIFASVHEKNISFKEKLFLSWIAPRGIIAAAVASLFAFTLEQHGFKEASHLATLTFMTIAITVVLQGLTAKPLAKFLGVLQTGTSGIVILGGNNLVVAIARELSNNGIPVMILDSNRLNCLAAEREGIFAFCGNVLNDQVWDDMDLTNFGSFIAATSNNELNSLAALRAAQIFAKNKIYQIRNSYENEKHPFTLDMIAGNQNYNLSLDVMGISSSLQYGNSIIESVKPDWLNKEQTEKSIILFGIEKGKVLFSTDLKKLSSADNIIRIYNT